MSENLRKIGHHLAESEEGWSVDTSSFLDLIYRDGQTEAKVTMEGAGTLFSPCDVWLSSMRLRPLQESMELPDDLKLTIEKRIESALKVLEIRYRRR
jgi:hypothetical protein